MACAEAQRRQERPDHAQCCQVIGEDGRGQLISEPCQDRLLVGRDDPALRPLDPTKHRVGMPPP